MARGLQGVIRFRRHQVDEARRALGVLLGHAAELERRVLALEQEILDEQQVAAAKPEEAGFIYGPYALRAIQRRAQLARARQEVEQRIARAQDGVRQEFRDLKVFEIAQDHRDAAEEKESQVAEQAVLDEVGLQLYREGGVRDVSEG
jgi:flagellar export protein FliJ